MNEKNEDNQAGETKLTELIAKFGEGIKGLKFEGGNIYLLLGDKEKIDQRELLWVGRALDKAGIDVIIGMIEPDALRVIELKRPESEKTTGERLIYVPERFNKSN